MNVGNSGARFRITAIIAVISLTLGGMFGISSASGDEGAEETPIAVATAEESSFEPGRVPAEAPDPVIVDELYNDWFECSGVWLNTGAIVQYYTWDEATQDWVLGEPVEVWGDPVKVRDLTPEEQVREGCSTPEPSEEPSEDPSEEPSDLPTSGDLLVQCAPAGQLFFVNNHPTWLASVIVGYSDASGNEVPLGYDFPVQPGGGTYYHDVSKAPSGSQLMYWTVWLDLDDEFAGVVENGGAITCGEPTSSPTPTPSASASPAPSVDPTPTQTVKPTPTESAEPSPVPTATKSADPKPTKAPAKPSGKSDDRVGPPSTGVSDDGNAVAAFAGLVIVITTAVAAMTRQRRKN